MKRNDKNEDVKKGNDFNFNKGFSVFYTNAGVLTTKLDELRLIARNKQPKFISVCEVKPKRQRYKITPAELQIDGYEMFHNDFNVNKTRGVVIYVHKSIEAQHVEVESQVNDSVFLKITLNNSDQLLLGCIYRHQTDDEGKEKFLSMMSRLPYDKYTHTLLTGDFNFRNIDWSIWESSSSKPQDLDNRFIEIVRDAYLYQHVKTPTRCRTGNTPSCLDLVFTNEEGMVSDIEISSPLGKGDHACITFWFNCYVHFKKVQFQKYMYDNGDYEAIRKELNIDWEEELKSRNTVNEKWNYIAKKIHTSTNTHIPKCKSTPSKRLKYNTPLDAKSLAKIKKKHQAWKKYMASRESEHYRDYCKYRNQVRNITKKARKEQEKGVAKDAKNNPKKILEICEWENKDQTWDSQLTKE